MQFSEKQKIYITAWHQLIHWSDIRFQRVSHFFEGDFEKAWNASIKELMIAGLDKKALEKIQKNRHKINPETTWAHLKKIEAEVLILGEDIFPTPLSVLDKPPVILFMRGNLKTEDFPSLAMVGSRKISNYGKRATEYFVDFLVEKGLTIVSGLAYGADICAQKRAFEKGGRTIGFMANSIDAVYPSAHDGFVKKVLSEDRGAFFSEYLPGTPTRSEYFPVRNRLVAGFSAATMIVEATEKSGTLITARLANEYGKEVIALPGEIFSKNFMGNHKLISEGAMIASSPEEVWANLGWKTNDSIRRDKSASPHNQTHSFSANEDESKILGLLHSSEAKNINAVIMESGMPSAGVLSLLMMMEMRGWVRDMGGQNFVKNL